MSHGQRWLCAASMMAFSALARPADAPDREPQTDAAPAPHEHGVQPGHADHSRHPVQHGNATQTESQMRHVPPPPPERPLTDLSNERMIELMDMSDTSPFAAVMLDQLEGRFGDDDEVFAWDASAWFGNDYTRGWLTSEGSIDEGQESARNELVIERVVSVWWSVQGAVRHDLTPGPSRTWGGVGVRGAAPFGYEAEAMLYVGEGGSTALRLAVDGDWKLTQRLVLQPELDIDVRGSDDERNGIAHGWSSSELGLRLRYEIRREFAPYIGVHWSVAHGETADLRRQAGEERSELEFAAGVRAWW